jgi:hypothetical protein
MFKDYSDIAHAGADEATTRHQAHLHGGLVKFLHDFTKVVEIEGEKEVYDHSVEQVENTFLNNCSRGTIAAELENVARLPKSKGKNYYSNNYYCREDPVLLSNKLGSNLNHHIRDTIRVTILEIARKEKYLEYKLNETEDTIKEARLSDAVSTMTNVLSGKYGSCDLYDLQYSKEGDRGFLHQVIYTTANGVRTRPEITVDLNWVRDVFDKNFAVLEYEGTHAFTTKSEMIEIDPDKTLYDLEIVQVQGNRNERTNASYSTYGRSENSKARELFKVKEVVLAVSTDGTHSAIGSTAARATSTMRRRQKAAMIKSLNL